MGCCYSRVEREETVSRCKARKRYMKQFVKARQAFAASHALYLRSLRTTGSALLHFAAAEILHHHHIPPQPLFPSPPPPPMSPNSDTWTTTTSTTTSTALPPPPPPPQEASSGWDFWDPFVASSSSMLVREEEEWEETTVASPAAFAARVAPPPPVVSGFSKESELAVVVSTKSKDLVEIIKELDEYFLRAADAGAHLSSVLEVPTCVVPDQRSTGKVYEYGKSGKSLSPLLWTWGSCHRLDGFGKLGEEVMVGSNIGGGDFISGSHCSTVDKLYAWEKKLYLEVKNVETLKMEHEKRAEQLRKLELNRGDYVKTEKMKKEVEKLESRMMVAFQAIESTSAEIVKLREFELYPQLVELVKGLMGMWRSLYECHHVQTHIVKQLKYLNAVPSTDPTSEIHRQSTLQLELEIQKWHLGFCNLVKAQRDYVQSLTGWLRLSLFHVGNSPLSKSREREESAIYSLCEEWHLAMDRVPDKVASEGIKSFLMVIHAIVVQQGDEQKQKKRSESTFKELEKRVSELRSLESKYGQFLFADASRGARSKDPIVVKREKVESLRAKAEEEKAKHEKSVSQTRGMTLNNLQMGLPHVFETLTSFANVCIHAFETVSNQARNTHEVHDVKRILPN
ncbi:protein ALTERED PHOSPHATE STARVATION RESPONSE 1 [Actinidia eriantha]|uniref:protein ALTERED PHOSPHATE STARVATION RESPONSE 1 n=1 Tax=Actinidia eriantha TaxID=165200 RepID=UPI0025899C83|nr:protein ALTERED PHOSPHATE STARVATION RESPONSE 1 [Actinidia eriantha]